MGAQRTNARSTMLESVGVGEIPSWPLAAGVEIPPVFQPRLGRLGRVGTVRSGPFICLCPNRPNRPNLFIKDYCRVAMDFAEGALGHGTVGTRALEGGDGFLARLSRIFEGRQTGAGSLWWTTLPRPTLLG